MEEMMMVRKMTAQETSPDHHHHNLKIPKIISTACPTWKLYENPFYIYHNQQQQQISTTTTTDQSQKQQQIHRLHLPVSSRKIAASFWDLTFIMEAEMSDVRSELERERKARKNMESLNKRLARELSEERRGREALERVCEQLAREISADKAEVSRMRREIEDERKMLRTAEVIREERVQMKLSDAKNLLEEKLSELQTSRNNGNVNGNGSSSSRMKKHQDLTSNNDRNIMSFGEKLRFVLGEKMPASANSASPSVNYNLMQRRSSGETENPHIKRGIKGFVEFPKVVRAIGCRSRSSSSKLECQKAQLKILLKQKGPLRFNGLITR